MSLHTRYSSVSVDGLNIFYREAGNPSRPTLLLLHGFPTSSLMFRDLIPRLADQYHVVAPDLPGFGFSDMPDRGGFEYSFAKLTSVIDAFTVAVGLSRYALYVFDYGAPIGLRLALKHPERVTALISQNGNAYEEGLSDGWGPIRSLWAEPSEDKREAIRGFYSLDAVKFQYVHGTPDAGQVAPETYTFDHALLSRPGAHEVQLDLILDYRNNVVMYPQFQAYLRSAKPPLLAVWGRNDPFFLPAGAEAFKRDIPSARVKLFDTGHFALETHGHEIASEIRMFMQEVVAA